MTVEHLETLIAFAVVMLGVSLLITVLTQMVSALLGLRGTNLLWGIKTLFNAVDPKIVSQAEAVLRDPLISDSAMTKWDKIPVIGWFHKKWTLASAIQPAELARKLGEISADLQAIDPKTGKPKDTDTAAAIDKVLSDLDPEVARQARLLRAVTAMAAPAAGQQLDQRVQQFVESARKSAGKLETLFDTAMTRVSARFGLYMRVWTVLFAGLLAFVLHLDSFKLLEQLWSNPQMRASLVNSQDAMMKEAAAVVALPPGSAQASAASVEPLAYTAALDTLKKKEPAATKGLGDTTPAFATLDAAVKWIEPQLIADENGKKALIAEYTRLVSAELMDRATKIRSLLESSGFQLIPKPYPGLFCYGGMRGVLGILFTWVLLSLGAPFWFNALKTLSNLRPVLAAAQPPKDKGATT